MRTFQILLLLLFSFSPVEAAISNLLTEKITRIEQKSGGVLGVSIRRSGSGAIFQSRGQERFPMASTFKLPLAIAILDRVDRGELRLDQPVPIELRDIRTWSSPVASAHPKGGVALPLSALLKAILVDSDNTAADALLRSVESPKALTDWLHAKGLNETRVDRNEGQLALDEASVKQHPPMESWTPALFKSILDKATPQEQLAGLKALTLDPRDTTTPEQMTTLLERLLRGGLLKPKSTELVFQWMTATVPRPKRIKGLLPAGTLVVHRPGTAGNEHYGAATNDVGVIALPQGKGRLVIAVYLKASTASEAQRDLAIAEVAKAAWDRFTQ